MEANVRLYGVTIMFIVYTSCDVSWRHTHMLFDRFLQAVLRQKLFAKQAKFDTTASRFDSGTHLVYYTIDTLYIFITMRQCISKLVVLFCSFVIRSHGSSMKARVLEA